MFGSLASLVGLSHEVINMYDTSKTQVRIKITKASDGYSVNNYYLVSEQEASKLVKKGVAEIKDKIKNKSC